MRAAENSSADLLHLPLSMLPWKKPGDLALVESPREMRSPPTVTGIDRAA